MVMYDKFLHQIWLTAQGGMNVKMYWCTVVVVWFLIMKALVENAMSNIPRTVQSHKTGPARLRSGTSQGHMIECYWYHQ